MNAYLELLHQFLIHNPQIRSIPKLQLKTFVLLAIKMNSARYLHTLACCAEFAETVASRFAVTPFFAKFNAANLSVMDFACHIHADACIAWLYDYVTQVAGAALGSISDVLSILRVLINQKAIKQIKEFFVRYPHVVVTEDLAERLYPLCGYSSVDEEQITLEDIIVHVPLENYTTVVLSKAKPADLEWLGAIHAALSGRLEKAAQPNHKHLFAARDAIAYHIRIQTIHQGYEDETLHDPYGLAYELYEMTTTHPDRAALVQAMRKTLMHGSLHALRKERTITLHDGRCVNTDLIRFFCLLEEAEEFLALVFARVKHYQFSQAADTIDPLLVAVEGNRYTLFERVASRTPQISATVYFALLQRGWSPTQFSGFYGCVFEYQKIMAQLLENFPTTYSVNSYFELLVFCHHYKKWCEQNKVPLPKKDPINKIKAKLEQLLGCKFSDKEPRMFANKNNMIPKSLNLVQACEVFFTGLLNPCLRNTLMDHIESLLSAPDFDPTTISLSLLKSICDYTPRLSRSGGVADVVRVLMYVFCTLRSLTHIGAYPDLEIQGVYSRWREIN